MQGCFTIDNCKVSTCTVHVCTVYVDNDGSFQWHIFISRFGVGGNIIEDFLSLSLSPSTLSSSVDAAFLF